jgi:hypothetical protein
MSQQEWWQLPVFPAPWRRMTLTEYEAVVGVEGASTRAWLMASDVIIAHHRTQHQARRWISSVHHQYPTCLLAVARHRRGRWCLLGLPARTLVVRGGYFDTVTAEQIGRVFYQLWMARKRAQS